MADRGTERDAGLARVSSLTRWTAAGAAGLAGVFSIVAARPHLPKVNLHAVSNQITGNQPTTGGSGGPSEGATAGVDPGLQPPAQAPQASQAPAPQAQSGGS